MNAYVHVLRSILLRDENILDNNFRENQNTFYVQYTFSRKLCLLGDYLLLLLLFTAMEFSAGESSPYISTDETNKNKMYIKETIQNYSTNNKKRDNVEKCGRA
jgi:hypothetical protein